MATVNGSVNYEDSTPIPKQQEYTPDNIQPIAIELAKFIRTKMYGTDVRESLARWIEIMLAVQTYINDDETAFKVDIQNKQDGVEDRQTQVEGTMSDVVDQFKAVISNVTKDSEVALARDSVRFGDYTVLDDRLEYIESWLAAHVPAGFHVSIKHNQNRQPKVVVHYYEYAIGTETHGLGTGPYGLGETSTQTISCTVDYLDDDTAVINLPLAYALTGIVTYNGGYWYLIDGYKTLRFDLGDDIDDAKATAGNGSNETSTNANGGGYAGDLGLSSYQIAVKNGFTGNISQWLASLVGPKGDKGDSAVLETFANLAEIKNKYPSGKNGLMIAADNGHKYIWANNVWTDAGVYQSVGIANNSIMDKQIAAPAKSGAYLLPTEPVDFDFTNKIITISKGSLVGVGQKINEPLASDVLVPFSSNTTQILLFNQETKAFRAVATYQTDLMTADEVILARYNTYPTVQRVSANFDYTVNGAPLDTKNIAGSKFIIVHKDSKITYDFVNKQVVIPASLAFFAGNMHYYNTDWNPKQIDLVIPFPTTGDTLKLVFNQQTKSFSVLSFSTIITTSQTIVSSFFISTELIVQFDNRFIKLSAKQGSNIIEPLPGYVNAEISRVNDEVINLAGPDKLIIAWQTDVHNYDSHIRALVQLQRLGQLDYIVNGGDLSYESPLANMRAKFDSQKLLMEPSQTPWVTIRGNHDGSGTNKTISEITNSEFNRRMNWNQTSKKMWIDDGTGNGYGYIDDDKHQIRMIFINNAAIDNEQQHRLGIDDVQLKWIIEHALDLSEKSDDEKNWQVLMFGHVPIDSAFTTGAIIQGADVLEAGIAAFKTGTIYINESLDISCNFTPPHIFIAFVNGHMHFDQIGINGKGFMEVCTASSQPDHFTSSNRLTPDSTSPERTLNDVTEDCWDVLVIDPAKKHVDLVRYGAGENRKFDY